ncbi:nickel transporter [Streptomyces sp. NPDC008163]|uniref:nickel transporter n=1 Tax=Streptomyces sp. NPDC008163 TaxID=3364818 RepID=UPI0036E7E97E
MNVPRRAATVAVPVLVLFGLASAPMAHAHPLGNFSVNHHDGLRMSHDRIQDTAVVDSAEIPTAQDWEATDTDHNGMISPAEAAGRAAERCSRLADRTRVTVGDEPIVWTVGRSTLTYGKGAAGLPVARLTCALGADADLSRSTTVSFTSGADASRTGWKEVTAVADGGVRLAESSVPTKSPSDVLRHYPRAGDEPPLEVVGAELRTEPAADGTAAHGAPGALAPGENAAAQAADRGAVLFPALEHRLTALTASRDLTWPMGLLAVVLTLLLGAGHAALPGHAKLVVAACLARREGGLRAALAVGTTVTATHTAGVLAMGLILTAGGGLVGERLLGWLGALSGALIAVLGMVLAATAVRSLRTGRPPAHWHHGHTHAHQHDHAHAHAAHAHAHSHGSGHSHDHSDHTHEADTHKRGAARRTGLPALLGVGLAAGLVPSPSALVVLLGAIALSRTYFGVLLVIGYGAGMALTLTAAGLLLSGSGTRMVALGERRLPSLRRYTRYTTLLTALAVLTVGTGLTLRSVLTL